MIYDGLAEQKKVSPVLLSFVSLPILFIVYQGGGAILVTIFNSILPFDSIFNMRLAQFLTQLLFLAIPTYLFVRLHTQDVLTFTFLKNTPKIHSAIYVLIPISMLVVQPFIQYLGGLERQIPWPQEMVNLRTLMENMLKEIVTAKTPMEFLFVALVVSVAPALTEELFFRGYLQRNLSRAIKGPWLFVLTGTIFGLFHFNPFQASGLIILGIYFSFLVWITRSLWTGIIAHFVNNFMAALVLFLNEYLQMNWDFADPTADVDIPFSFVAFSLVIFGSIIVLIIKLSPPKET